MTDLHTNGRVTHPDRRTLASAEATQIRLASYLPDDVEDGLRVCATSTRNEADTRTVTQWDRFVRLAELTFAAYLLAAVLGFLVLIAVGSGVVGS
jgi:hypothetical protein